MKTPASAQTSLPASSRLNIIGKSEKLVPRLERINYLAKLKNEQDTKIGQLWVLSLCFVV